jgi:predicted Rdx family selenoprotein
VLSHLLTSQPQYAQELLSTFSDALGEVSLQPSTSGTFVITMTHQQPPPATTATAPSSSQGVTAPGTTTATTSSFSPSPATAPTIRTTQLWDRRSDGGFPETKELKRRVRDVIEPNRHLGHVDRSGTFGPGSDHDKKPKRAAGGQPVLEGMGEMEDSERQGNNTAPSCDPNSKDVCEDCN